jgi:small subunit ribosomal protein S17
MADEEKNETTETPAEDETPQAAAEPEAVEESVIKADETQPEAEAPAAEAAPEADAEEAAAAEEPAAEAVPEAEAEEPAAAEEPAEGEGEEPAEAGEAAAPQPARKPKRKRLPRALRHKHPKPMRERPAERRPIVRLPKPEHARGRRQERRGVVVSSGMDKTIVVKVDTVKAHPRYKKVVRRSTKFHAHDAENAAKVGDLVRIVETRPLSKTKNWRLAEVLEEAK